MELSTTHSGDKTQLQPGTSARRDAPLPICRAGRHQGRFVLYSWVEQKPCTRFDDTAHFVFLQAGAQFSDLGVPVDITIERIEQAMTHGEGDRAITDLGQELGRFDWVLVCQAAGVLA